MPLTDEEKRRIYREERERLVLQRQIDNQLFKARIVDKVKRGRVGCSTMLVVAFFITVAISILSFSITQIVSWFRQSSGSTNDRTDLFFRNFTFFNIEKLDPYGENSQDAKVNSLNYYILRESRTPKKGTELEILVSKDAKKEDVLTLAKHLRFVNRSAKYFYLNIYDSRDAYDYAKDNSYPQGKLNKHFLLTLIHDEDAGYDRFEWLAKGRDH